jgi:hypothetical protein
MNARRLNDSNGIHSPGARTVTQVIRLVWISQQFKAALYNPDTTTRATDATQKG